MIYSPVLLRTKPGTGLISLLSGAVLSGDVFFQASYCKNRNYQ